jgi:hypothetical protein
MWMYRVLSAVAAAAVGAALMMALPVEAGTSNPAIKTDRLDYRPSGPECTQQAWPYYRPDCLRDRTQPSGAAKVVRVVSTDRLPK